MPISDLQLRVELEVALDVLGDMERAKSAVSEAVLVFPGSRAAQVDNRRPRYTPKNGRRSADQRGHGIGVALDTYTKADLESRRQAVTVLENALGSGERRPAQPTLKRLNEVNEVQALEQDSVTH